MSPLQQIYKDGIIMTDRALSRLLQLSSPALPVGAYAYSRGFESAIEECAVHDLESTRIWISSLFRYSLTNLDLPMLVLFFRSWQQSDFQRVKRLNEFLLASRETAEFRLEDVQMGRSLGKLLQAFSINYQGVLSEPTFVSQFAQAGVAWGIQVEDLLHGFCWSWLESQVTVATKLVPLGQTEAQLLLSDLADEIEQATQLGQLKCGDVDADDDIVLGELGQCLPGLAIMSSRHEIQHTRLFRS